MTTNKNPFEVAREPLRLRAARRIAPTPDHYQTLYNEIAGVKAAVEAPASAGAVFPEKQLRALAAALPKEAPDQLRLARQLEEALGDGNWEDYKKHLTSFVEDLTGIQRLTWGELISDLLRQWGARHPGLTTARKRESLEHVLTSSSANPENLYNRLQALLRSWGQGREQENSDEANTDGEAEGEGSLERSEVPGAGNNPHRLLGELRELFAFTLETAIATQLHEDPQLTEDAKKLAKDIRKARAPEELEAFLARLKRFGFKRELLAEDHAELRASLLGLLRLLVENIDQLVIDDHWLQGQIAVVRESIDKRLSQRAIDD